MEQGDAISRRAALDAMPKSDVLLRHQVVDVICNSPPIDVAPVVHAYWIKQITRVLLEIRDNCVPKDGEAYDDPKRMEKYDALNAAIDLINNPSQLVTGDTSDGYHTFNELYHHRAVLFSVIVKAFPDKAWKSKQHNDGTMYDGMFIVGIDTPEGQATYHYDIDPYWDMFECHELARAPKWDGHTPAQAIERIGRLEPVRRGI